MNSGHRWQNLHETITAFAEARQWQQFHTPKNLTMALAVEAAELMEHFQWMEGPDSAALSPPQKTEVAYEMADVLIYLMRLSQTLNVDLLDATAEKLQINEQKYPVDSSRGRAVKPKN